MVIFATYMDLHFLLEGKKNYMPLTKGFFGMAPITDSLTSEAVPNEVQKMVSLALVLEEDY